MVTCNYKARESGVKKLQLVSEALQACPNLVGMIDFYHYEQFFSLLLLQVLVNGEDLTKYKKMSDQIFQVLTKFISTVEKLGLDENFLDVTDLVNEALASGNQEVELFNGTHIYNPHQDGELLDECDCGCIERLLIGTQVAGELRNALFQQLKITSCAGIAYNKLLAKLIGSRNKPNQQTIIFSSGVSKFMSSLGSVRSLVGVGQKLADTLAELNIKTIEDLQFVSHEVLRKKIDEKMVQKLKSWCFGVDTSQVKATGKPKSLSLEDSTFGNPLKSIYEVETKLSLLLTRLCDAVCEDGRVPATLRLVVRKTNTIEEINQRESRQIFLSGQLFKRKTDKLELSDDKTLPQIINLAMNLFSKIMGEKKQDFVVTLLGVSFTNFTEVAVKSVNRIDRFLVPKSKSNDPPKDGNKRVKDTTDDLGPPSKRTKPSPLQKWIEGSKFEPSTKKEPVTPTTSSSSSTSSNDLKEETTVKIPPNIDPGIFISLPVDVQQELLEQWNSKSKTSMTSNQVKRKSNPNTLDKFLKPTK